jgi:uncharacterized protein (DUF1800 family)
MPGTVRPPNPIDPRDAWSPWHRSSTDPWSRKWIGHLYRRAGFGASRLELLEAEKLGPEATIDLLFRGRPEADERLEDSFDSGRIAAERDDDGARLRGWWLYWMLHSGHPLREKLALFWHNHFATSIAKVREPALMHGQVALLRKQGMGRFGPLLQSISKDPAMLVWLDSNSNVRGRPNENYARELMELFSLGVGHYSERDIREAARAFTGWHTDGKGFTFNRVAHDDGAKTVLGRTGNWNGGDVVRIVLAQPAAARFLVRKLYRYFVNENTEPSDEFLGPLADSFRKSDYDVSALVRTILSSRHFFSEYAFRQRIKSPVEYVLGSVQAVCGIGGGQSDRVRVPQQVLVPWVGAMGQELFAPPNVKGWPGGRAWLNTSTVLARNNFAEALTTGSLWNEPAQESTSAAAFTGMVLGGNTRKPAHANGNRAADFDPARLLREEKLSTPEAIVGAVADLYMPGGVPPQTRAALVGFISEGQPSAADLDERVREAVHGLLTSADYQLG